MNRLRSHDDKIIGIPVGIKIPMLVCVLGIIVVAAYHSLAAPTETIVTPAKAVVVPPEAPVTGPVSVIAPFEATAMSADGRGTRAILPPTVAQGARVEQRATAPTPRTYPEPGSDAVRDEDGHPKSF